MTAVSWHVYPFGSIRACPHARATPSAPACPPREHERARRLTGAGESRRRGGRQLSGAGWRARSPRLGRSGVADARPLVRSRRRCEEASRGTLRFTGVGTGRAGGRDDARAISPPHVLALVSLGPRLRPLHAEDEAVVAVAVELVDRPLRVVAVQEVDESEAAALARLAVEGDVDAADRACVCASAWRRRQAVSAAARARRRTCARLLRACARPGGGTHRKA